MATNECIAYRDDGKMCRLPASVIDEQRGGVVCPEHGFAALVLSERNFLMRRDRESGDGFDLAADTIVKLRLGIEKLQRFKSGVDEGLNSGDGSYRP